MLMYHVLHMMDTHESKELGGNFKIEGSGGNIMKREDWGV